MKKIGEDISDDFGKSIEELNKLKTTLSEYEEKVNEATEKALEAIHSAREEEFIAIHQVAPEVIEAQILDLEKQIISSLKKVKDKSIEYDDSIYSLQYTKKIGPIRWKSLALDLVERLKSWVPSIETMLKKTFEHYCKIVYKIEVLSRDASGKSTEIIDQVYRTKEPPKLSKDFLSRQRDLAKKNLSRKSSVEIDDIFSDIDTLLSNLNVLNSSLDSIDFSIQSTASSSELATIFDDKIYEKSEDNSIRYVGTIRHKKPGFTSVADAYFVKISSLKNNLVVESREFGPFNTLMEAITFRRINTNS